MRPFDRNAAELTILRTMRVAREKERLAAEKMFEEKAGLDEAIQKEILPSLVVMKAQDGRFGTGFFQHQGWLVSNAHVAPSRDLLNTMQFRDTQANPLDSGVVQAYLRPAEKRDSPDVIIVKTRTNSQKCLPLDFLGDEGYHERHFFYLDIHSCEQPVVRYLELVSKPNKYPLLYRSLDGSIGCPGCSGTPIIQARVLFAGTPKWEFRVVGALYARFSSPQYADVVCAIPIGTDFRQVLSIIQGGVSADRFQKMASACDALGDNQAKRDAQRYRGMGTITKEKALGELFQYESGFSPINVSLPHELEKLHGKEILPFSKSSLLAADKKENNYKAKSRQQLQVEDLEDDIQKFMEYFSNQKEKILLQNGNNSFCSPDCYFRIDTKGGAKSDWILELQDKTGRGKFKGQPVSSTFAIVKVPLNNRDVSGPQLAKCFKESQKLKKAINYLTGVPDEQEKITRTGKNKTKNR